MKRLTKYLYVLSFDGLSTLDFNYISTLPNFKSYIEKAAYSKQVYSVYPSLTYPAHATIVTGKYPKNHGVINNTLLQINRKSPDWYWQRKYIKGETLYDLAIDKGIKVAALLWPVTGKSKIQYNLPEIFANRPWQNQIFVSLMNGSPMYQYILNKKFGYLRRGLKQPYLDNFVHASLLNTIEEKDQELVLVHYTDLDTMRHHHGFYSEEAREALERLDQKLGDIINAMKDKCIYEESTLVVLGDHSSLDEDKIINLNVLLKEKGYINVKNTNIIDYKAIAKSCDGSAYLYVKEDKLIEELKELLYDFNEQEECIENIYSRQDAEKLGADPKCAMLIEAKKGFYFLDEAEGTVIKQIQPGEAGRLPEVTAATHGYSPLKENYTTVFMASGKGINKGNIIEKMNLVDEGPTLAALLGLQFKECDGEVLKEFLQLDL
ncbi:ectonucleotide pyrophosphatase/phosphodiesterase [Clostridium thailandense]|uniref:alkaline phosphatase family protein n=1 Tax=Clostridium thailandense TaxID=2794346 RepID=UPI003989AA2D